MSEYIFKPDQLSKDFQEFFYRQKFEYGTPLESMNEKWKEFLHNEILPRKQPTENFFSFYSINPDSDFEVIGHYGVIEYFNFGEPFTNQLQLTKQIYSKQLPFFLSLAKAIISFTNDDFSGRVGTNKEISAYQVTAPMKLKNDKFYTVIQLTQPVSFDKNKRLIGALNRYKVLGEYKGEPLKPYIYSNGKIPNEDRVSDRFSSRARRYLKEMYDVQNVLFPFSPALLKSLLYYAQKENYGQTAVEEGRKRNISPRTCTSNRTKIIGKAKALTDRRFPDVFTVVDYFTDQGFLPGRNIFIPSFDSPNIDA